MNQFYSPLNTLSLNNLFRLPRLNGIFEDEPASRLPGHRSRSWVPQVDIRELDDSFKVQVDIPGVDPKSIDITVDRNVLTIKGSRFQETEDEGQGYKRLERSFGTFLRQFTLPETADGSLITASANHGVLEISIPKSEKNKPRTISVDV